MPRTQHEHLVQNSLCWFPVGDPHCRCWSSLISRMAKILPNVPLIRNPTLSDFEGLSFSVSFIRFLETDLSHISWLASKLVCFVCRRACFLSQTKIPFYESKNINF